MAEWSGGAFDPTVDPLVRLWGFGAAGGGGHRVPDRHEIDAALARVGWGKIGARLDPPALKKSQPDAALDLSALTCGFALDELAARLDALGVRDYLIELGGALRARGASQHGRPWRTGVELPPIEAQKRRGAGDFEPKKIACIVELADKSISTSGSYKQFFEAGGRRFFHIIDARTGRPVAGDLVSVTVVADTCIEADALDTALLSMDTEAAWELASQRGLAALFILRTERGFAEKRTAPFVKLETSGSGSR